MEYTIEQKRDALSRCALWWRFPASNDEYISDWSRITDDLFHPVDDDLKCVNAEYHIGDEPPTPPRVLSELERELLVALERYVQQDLLIGTVDDNLHRTACAVIAKAKGET